MASDVIMTALEREVVCYERLAKLAELQHEQVQQGQTEALLEVLNQRQAVLDEICELERTVAPARRGWGEYVLGLSQDRRPIAESLLGRTRALLERITQADRNDAMVLQQRKLNLGREIRQATAGRAINRTYAAAAYGRPSARVNVQS